MSARLLTLNAGSSSIKFAVYASRAAGDGDSGLDQVARGQLEGLGASPRLIAKAAGGSDLMRRDYRPGEIADHHQALGAILELIETGLPKAPVLAVGHRVVHGGVDFAEPLLIESGTMPLLERFVPLAPLHQPHNLSGIRAAQSHFPRARHVACFDTAFHRRHPWVNDTFALPRELYEAGIRRYGFHGLSYEYVTEEMTRRMPLVATGRMVVAHLGNGASVCAIRHGRSIGSTMGFTALDGLPMGTRCGQLDPGVVLYLMQEKGMGHAEVTRLLYTESGLKGLSGLSHDMRTLEASDQPEAAQAIDYFVSRVRREIGAMMALIGGLDVLVFCGGIGENSVRLREAVCAGFEWAGLELDGARNRGASPVISSEQSRVKACVVRTDEEAMIARHTWRALARKG